MKSMKYIVSLLMGILFLSACDSREDWWVENDEKPEIVFEPGQIDSTKWNGSDDFRFYQIELKCGEEKRFHVNSITKSYGQDFSVRLNYVGAHRDSYFYDEDAGDNRDWEHALIPKYMEIFYDNTTNDLVIKHKVTDESLQRSIYDYWLTLNPLDEFHYCAEPNMYYLTLELGLTNCVGTEKPLNFSVKMLVNEPPVVDIDVVDIEGMEKRIVVDAKDPEGMEVIAYEYCFNGKATWLRQAYEYEQHRLYEKTIYERTKPEPINDSRLDKEMLYIPSTKLSSINHAFQSKGKHIIMVRAKDKLGCWSAWKSKEITVN